MAAEEQIENMTPQMKTLLLPSYPPPVPLLLISQYVGLQLMNHVTNTGFHEKSFKHGAVSVGTWLLFRVAAAGTRFQLLHVKSASRSMTRVHLKY